MWDRISIAVVVPAFEEAAHLDSVLRGIPPWIDRIFVVDDASRDDTSAVAARVRDARVHVIRHERNQGVGAAIVSGYRAVVAAGIDVAVVMAGDGQMDPAELGAVVAPVASGAADYAKGDRLRRRGAWRAFPVVRLVGTIVLSWATRLATGYRGLTDSQCGYTAISASALRRLDLDSVYPRYGYPNDLLIRLARIGARVDEVPVTAIYGAGETSRLRVTRVAIPIAMILARGVAGRVLSRVRRRSRREAGARRPRFAG